MGLHTLFSLYMLPYGNRITETVVAPSCDTFGIVQNMKWNGVNNAGIISTLFHGSEMTLLEVRICSL